MSADVFLSHSTADKPAVEALAHRLAEEGIQAWLDKWNLIPGDSWQPAIEKALAESETCAVFVGYILGVMRRLEWIKHLRDIHRLHKAGLPGEAYRLTLI